MKMTDSDVRFLNDSIPMHKIYIHPLCPVQPIQYIIINMSKHLLCSPFLFNLFVEWILSKNNNNKNQHIV